MPVIETKYLYVKGQLSVNILNKYCIQVSITTSMSVATLEFYLVSKLIYFDENKYILWKLSIFNHYFTKSISLKIAIPCLKLHLNKFMLRSTERGKGTANHLIESIMALCVYDRILRFLNHIFEECFCPLETNWVLKILNVFL